EADDSFVASYRNVTATDGCDAAGGPCYTAVGLAPSARVFALNFGLGYGIADSAEVYVNLPVVVTNASADVSYTSRLDDDAFRDASFDVDGESVREIARGGQVRFDDFENPGEEVVIGLRRRNLNDLALGEFADASFSDGTNVG